jgi:predicted methyltransferase
MNTRAPFLVGSWLLVGCAGKPATEPPAVSVASAADSVAASASATPVASAAPTTAAAPAPTDAERAQKGRAKADADHQTELARWTPELHANAKRLAETSYASTEAALEAVLASPHRQPGNAVRDKFRHPRETLEFFGLRPTSAVLEYGPGGGWYTELLAPALSKRGKLYVTSDDPNGSAGERSVAGYRLKLLLETSPELFAKVEPIPIDAKSPQIPFDGKLDLVLVIRELHNLVNDGSIDQWLAEFRHALKAKGVLGIVDHRALVGADPAKSAKLGYLPEAWAIEKIEAAGFKLAEKSEINANPKDTKDYPDGVWTLPPTYRLGAKDREKYAAIGESDRFTLRFVKNDTASAPAPAPKVTKQAKP